MRKTTAYHHIYKRLPIKQVTAFWLFLSCILIIPFIAQSQGQQSYTTAGTAFSFNVPANVTAIKVECWGSGGAGGGVGSVVNGAGGGGGGGAYAKSILPVTPGNSFSITVGAKGVGVNDSAGRSGQPSWFGSATTVLAAGGTGGLLGTMGFGGAAASSIGTVKYSGADGGNGFSQDVTNGGYSGGGGSSAGIASAGNIPLAATPWVGGIAPAGGGAGGDGRNVNSGPPRNGDGNLAKAVGGGGGGAKKASAAGTFKGGNGYDGQVIVSWPVISGFASNSGCEGTSITINGYNLSGATSVIIGGTPATVTSSTSTQIIATIGAGSSGTVTVTTDAGTVTSTASFTVYLKPAATIVSGGGTSCTSIVITASNGGDGTMFYQNTVSNGTSTAAASSSQTISASGTYYFRAQSSNFCWGNQGSAIVNINALPTVNAGGPVAAICQAGTTTALGGSFGGGATSAIWDDGGAGGTFTNNSGSTPGTTTYTSAVNAPPSVTLRLTTDNSPCGQVQASKNLTVNPVITGNISGDAFVCRNNPAPNIVFTASNGTQPYTFTYKINGGSTQTATTVSGNSISVPAAMTSAGTFTYTLLSVQDAGLSPCSQLQATNATVIIKEPVAITAQPSPVNTCSTVPVSFSVVATGDSLYYQWYMNGVALSNNSNISGSQTSVLNINQAQTTDAGNYYVIVSGSSACGTVQSNTVALNVSGQITIVTQPSPVAVCTGGTATFSVNATGTGINYQWWKGGTKLSDAGNISGATTPVLTITNVSAADAAANYKVVLTTLGPCSQSTSNDISLTVNPIPTVDPIDTQVVCSGSVYPGPVFTGSVAGTVYKWTNDNSSIGLGANGSGNLPSFTAVNTGNAPVYAHINVTPEYTNAGTTCTGSPLSFTIVANPGATVDALSSQVICNGGTTGAIHFSSPTMGGTIVFNWTNSNATIGLAPAGTGDISPFTGINNGTSPVTSTITVKPTYTNVLTTCVGVAETFNITVNPSPVVNAIADQVICSGTTIAGINFSSTATGGTITYNWTNSDPSIGIAASGIGAIPSFTATNNTASTITAIIKVKATFSNGSVSCDGPEQSFQFIVYPAVAITANPAAPQICSEDITNISLTGTAAGTSFNWTVLSQTGATGANAGSGSSIQQGLTVTGNSNGTVIYQVNAKANDCSASPLDLVVTVVPQVTVTPLAQSICNGDAISPIAITGLVTGSITSWTRNNPSGISSSIGMSGSGPISGTFTNSNTTAATVTFMITVQADNGCLSTRTVTVKVFASLSAVTVSSSQIICTSTLGNDQSATPLTSTAAKGGSDLGYTYQWQSADTSTGPWASVPGANNPKYTPPTTPKYYHLVVSNSCGSVTSNWVQIQTANSLLDAGGPGLAIPASLCDGQSFHYHLESGGITSSLLGTNYIKYTWQSQNPGNFTSDTTNPFGTVQLGTSILGPTKRYIADLDFTVHNTSNVSAYDTLTITPIIYKNNDSIYCALSPRVKSVIVDPIPAISDTIAATCSGTAFSITPANGIPGAANIVPADTKYSWSVPVVTGGLTGGSAQNAQTAIGGVLTNPTNTVQTATYTVTPATDSGCGGNSFKVTVSVNPTPVVATQSLTVCTGVSFSFAPVNNAPATIVPAGVIYSWSTPIGTGFTGGLSGSGNAITGTLSTTNPTPVTATYTVTPTAGSAVGGCAGTPFTFTVTINPKATASFNAPQTTVCYNGSASINFNGSPNTVVSYKANGTPATITLDNLGAAILNTGPLSANTTYALTGVGYTSPGATCTQPLSGSITILVNPQANATITRTPSSICIGQTSTLNFSGTPNTVVTYSNGSANQTVTLDAFGNAPVIVSPTSTTTYTLVDISFPGTPSCLKSLTGSATIIVDPGANAGSISGFSNPLCIGSTTPLASNGDAGGIWRSSNTGVATVNASGVVTAVTTGSADIRYIVTVGCNAPDTAVKTVTVNPDASAGIISGVTPLCINSNGIQFSTSGDAGGTWSSSSPSVVAINTTNGVVTTGSNTGTGIVISYKVTSGCNASVANPVVSSTLVDVVNASSVTAGAVSGPVNICANSSGLIYSIPSLANASDYAWGLPAGWSITSGDHTYSITVQTSSSSGSVSVNAGNACGYGPQSSLPVVVTPKGEWLGITSDWNAPINWCAGVVPDGLTDVYVPATSSVNPYNLPVLSADGTAHNLNMLASATLTLNGHNFTLNGAFTGSGTITGSRLSGLILNGTTSSLLFTPGSFNNYLKTFIINGGNITIGNELNIAASDGTVQTYGSTHGSVNINGGTLNSNGNLTLKSDINGDAVVGISSGQIAGNVTVERFIPGRRAWRFLSVPFASSSQTIRGAWQEGATPYPDYNVPNYSGNVVYNPKPGYGTAITYAYGTTAFGYDENTTANPGIKIWNAAISSPDWATLPQSVAATDGTNTQIINYPAYCLFVRGSRAVDLSQAVSAMADNTTLRMTGVLNTGTISKSYPTTATKAVLIGNPYASPINILSVLTANGSSKFTQNKFWVWDPRYAGTYGVGGYITYNGSLMVPSGSTYSGGTNAQSGQAFMLEATTGGTTSVTFTESCKITSEAANVFGIKAATLQKHPAIFTNLVLPTGELLDGVGTAFGKQYAAKVDKDDAAKLWNIDENIALVRDAATLAIEARPVPSNADTLFFRLYLRQQPYALKLFSQDLPENLPGKAWLVDKYLNTQTAVNLYDTTVYNFTPNTDTNSYRNRFMLVFNREKPVSKPGIDSLIQKIQARIYPNPVSGKTFRLILDNATDGNYTLTIYNTAGRLIATRNINYTYGQNTYSVTVPAGITSGTYIVQVMNDKGIVVASLPMIISR